MEVTVQQTPNPNALKFILSKRQFERPLSFPSAEKAQEHPLAAALFALGSVYNVFMVQDFVTVNKLPETPWEEIQADIEALLNGYNFEGTG